MRDHGLQHLARTFEQVNLLRSLLSAAVERYETDVLPLLPIEGLQALQEWRTNKVQRQEEREEGERGRGGGSGRRLAAGVAISTAALVAFKAIEWMIQVKESVPTVALQLETSNPVDWKEVTVDLLKLKKSSSAALGSKAGRERAELLRGATERLLPESPVPTAQVQIQERVTRNLSQQTELGQLRAEQVREVRLWIAKKKDEAGGLSGDLRGIAGEIKASRAAVSDAEISVEELRKLEDGFPGEPKSVTTLLNQVQRLSEELSEAERKVESFGTGGEAVVAVRIRLGKLLQELEANEALHHVNRMTERVKEHIAAQVHKLKELHEDEEEAHRSKKAVLDEVKGLERELLVKQDDAREVDIAHQNAFAGFRAVFDLQCDEEFLSEEQEQKVQEFLLQIHERELMALNKKHRSVEILSGFRKSPLDVQQQFKESLDRMILDSATRLNKASLDASGDQDELFSGVSAYRRGETIKEYQKRSSETFNALEKYVEAQKSEYLRRETEKRVLEKGNAELRDEIQRNAENMESYQRQELDLKNLEEKKEQHAETHKSVSAELEKVKGEISAQKEALTLVELQLEVGSDLEKLRNRAAALDTLQIKITARIKREELNVEIRTATALNQKLRAELDELNSKAKEEEEFDSHIPDENQVAAKLERFTISLSNLKTLLLSQYTRYMKGLIEEFTNTQLSQYNGLIVQRPNLTPAALAWYAKTLQGEDHPKLLDPATKDALIRAVAVHPGMEALIPLPIGTDVNDPVLPTLAKNERSLQYLQLRPSQLQEHKFEDERVFVPADRVVLVLMDKSVPSNLGIPAIVLDISCDLFQGFDRQFHLVGAPVQIQTRKSGQFLVLLSSWFAGTGVREWKIVAQVSPDLQDGLIMKENLDEHSTSVKIALQGKVISDARVETLRNVGNRELLVGMPGKDVLDVCLIREDSEWNAPTQFHILFGVFPTSEPEKSLRDKAAVWRKEIHRIRKIPINFKLATDMKKLYQVTLAIEPWSEWNGIWEYRKGCWQDAFFRGESPDDKDYSEFRLIQDEVKLDSNGTCVSSFIESSGQKLGLELYVSPKATATRLEKEILEALQPRREKLKHALTELHLTPDLVRELAQPQHLDASPFWMRLSLEDFRSPAPEREDPPEEEKSSLPLPPGPSSANSLSDLVFSVLPEALTTVPISEFFVRTAD